MQQQFLGFDHIDTRVRDLRAVEAFYARLLPALGLPTMRKAHVEGDRWGDESPQQPYNAVEFYEAGAAVPFFIGIIEDPETTVVRTRIAFRVSSKEELPAWKAFLELIGARAIEFTPSDEYPAIFFEDACGTKLELVARPPRNG